MGFNHTVSDMDKSLDRKRKVYDPETGEVIGEEPAFEGEENGLEVREDVIIYTEHGHRYMKNTRTGQVAHLGAGIGEQKHTEAILNFWGAQPELLDKGVERIWNFPLNREEVPTNRQLHNFAHYQQLLEGGSRELDATVQRDGEQDHFGTNYLFISQLGEKSPYGFSQDQQNASLKNLGVELDGKMTVKNPEILGAIGTWLNGHPNATGKGAYDELQQHLHTQFPDEVKSPQIISNQEEGKET